jgi:hypothetical protein
MTVVKFSMASLALAAVAGSFATLAFAAPEPVAAQAKGFELGTLQVFALRDADNMLENDTKTFGVGHTPAEVAAVLRGAGAPSNHSHVVAGMVLDARSVAKHAYRDGNLRTGEGVRTRHGTRSW